MIYYDKIDIVEGIDVNKNRVYMYYLPLLLFFRYIQSSLHNFL